MTAAYNNNQNAQSFLNPNYGGDHNLHRYIYSQERFQFQANALGIMSVVHMLALATCVATCIMAIVNTFLIGDERSGMVAAIGFLALAAIRWVFFEHGFNIAFNGLISLLSLAFTFLITFIALGGYSYLSILPEGVVFQDDKFLTHFLGGVNLFGGIKIEIADPIAEYTSESITSQHYTLANIIIGFCGIFFSITDMFLRTFFNMSYLDKPLVDNATNDVI